MAALRRTFVLLVLVLLASFLVVAQAPHAVLVGTVTDSSGAVIPGAVVQIRNIGTNETRSVSTDAGGEFTIPNLAAGRYETTVTHEGFRQLRQTDIELQIDQIARLEFKLEIGAVSESVTVTSSVPLLNTENAVKGDVMVTEEVVEMPLNGREFTDLALLVPGVMPAAQGGQGSVFSINGARSDNSHTAVDGFTNQDIGNGTAQHPPTLESIQEFKMQTSGYSAEYGRFAGGVMNMVLKSGTNQFHFSLFEFLRNDIFDARSFFDAGKPKLRQNQYGGTVGGPVRIPKVYNGRDRTFFFFSWESRPMRGADTALTRVPTPLERQGDFSATGVLKDPLGGNFPNSRIPAARFSPIALKIAEYYPLPNRSGANNYYGAGPSNDGWNSPLFKVDERFSSRDSLSYRFTKRYVINDKALNGSDLGTFGSVVNRHDTLMGLTYTHMFSPTMINEARMGFSRTELQELGYFQGHNWAADFGIPGLTDDPKLVGFPHITINGLANLGDNSDKPKQRAVNNFQWGDTLTWVKGKHMAKFGGDIVRVQFFMPYYNNINGTFSFLGRWTNQPYADFLLGLLDSSSRQVGTTNDYLLTSNFSVFAQDNWKVASRLTLSLGLRYEIPKPMTEKYGRLTSFIPEIGKLLIADDRTLKGTGIAFTNPAKMAVARDLGLPQSLVYTRWNDLAPRFGFAWRPFGGNRSVLRGGYGIFFGGTLENPIRNQLGNTFPFAMSQSISRKTTDPNYITLANPFPVAANLLSDVTNTRGFQLHAPTPQTQSWNLTVEREIGRGSAVEISYVGAKGTHLPRSYDLNQPYRTAAFAPTFPRPIAGFGTVTYFSFWVNSIYNAGTIAIRRRFARGFFYRLNYTYSKSIDESSQLHNNSDGGIAAPQDSRNLRAERGRSDWDRGHVVTGNFSYEIPSPSKKLFLCGWQITGTATAYTGQPFTPQVSNANLNQGDAIRPDRVAKGTLSSPTPERWFDISAFPVVPTGSFRFGNSGRGILDGPAHVNLNLGLFKNFKFERKGNLQFRWEAFNVTNHANFLLPEINVDLVTSGAIKGAELGRMMQFALRYQF